MEEGFPKVVDTKVKTLTLPLLLVSPVLTLEVGGREVEGQAPVTDPWVRGGRLTLESVARLGLVPDLLGPTTVVFHSLVSLPTPRLTGPQV